MKNIFGNLFTRKSAVRHLVQLGITVVLCVWSYVALALVTGNWKMFTLDASQVTDSQKLTGNVVGVFLMLTGIAIAGILTYWNAKKWMLPCLKRSGLYLLGAIPFINLLVPPDTMSSWWEEISTLNESDGTVTTYYDEHGKLYSTDGSIPLILAIPLGIIVALLKGISLSALNLIAAIGIPVLSPVTIVFGAFLTQILTDLSNPAALIIAIVCIVAVLVVFIIQPILALTKNKEAN